MTAVERAGGLENLRALGRPVKVALITCSKKKKRRPVWKGPDEPWACRARDLYQGDRFKLELELAERVTDCTYIVSAKHGLVELDEEIEPYELAVGNLEKEARAHWARLVAQSLRHKLRGLEVSLFVTLPEVYLSPILYELGLPRGRLEAPLRFIPTLGRQKRRLRELLAQAPRRPRAPVWRPPR